MFVCLCPCIQIHLEQERRTSSPSWKASLVQRAPTLGQRQGTVLAAEKIFSPANCKACVPLSLCQLLGVLSSLPF